MIGLMGLIASSSTASQAKRGMELVLFMAAAQHRGPFRFVLMGGLGSPAAYVGLSDCRK